MCVCVCLRQEEREEGERDEERVIVEERRWEWERRLGEGHSSKPGADRGREHFQTIQTQTKKITQMSIQTQAHTH